MFICFNGSIHPSSAAVLSAQNSSFKYGDGCFETIKVLREDIQLASLHFERLFLTMEVLKIEHTPELNETNFAEQILHLCRLNDVSESARVRLAVFRGVNNSAEYLIEALPLDAEFHKWNEKGLVIDIFPDGRKSCDALSNLKTANFLIYILAAIHAQEKGLDDCVVLNSENNLCDTSKANIFLIKDENIFTPALHQGCINGVMRRHVIDGLKTAGFQVYQKEINERDLLNADEVFVTNAIIGVRWVQRFKEKDYTCSLSRKLYAKLL